MWNDKENTIQTETSGESICLLAEKRTEGDFLFSFQFVYETLAENLCFPFIKTCYVCHLMTEGSAVLQTDSGIFTVKEGDLFFAFPGTPYGLTEMHQCKYMYISFAGIGLEEILNTHGVTKETPVAPGYEELIDHWFSGLGKCTEQNLVNMTKGILYYTLSLLPLHSGENNDVTAGITSPENNVIAQIRAIIDRSYGNSNLSLEYICRLYHYHPKYISRRFREEVGFHFSQYLQACRIQHASKLLRETDRTIQEIASAVGYKNALYFSRVFRKCKGMPPSEYRLNCSQDLG